MLDADDHVYPQDLEAAEAAAGVSCEPGDVLLIRTGDGGARRWEFQFMLSPIRFQGVTGSPVNPPGRVLSVRSELPPRSWPGAGRERPWVRKSNVIGRRPAAANLGTWPAQDWLFADEGVTEDYGCATAVPVFVVGLGASGLGVGQFRLSPCGLSEAAHRVVAEKPPEMAGRTSDCLSVTTRAESSSTMRLSRPRVAPVSLARFDELRRELFGETREPGERVLNVTRLWAVHPALMKAQRALQVYLLRDSTLPPRLRELAILRVGWRCDSGYELAQHAVFGLRAGLEESDLRRVTLGPDEAGWTMLEAAVVRAVDEMLDDNFVSTATWSELSRELSDEQLMDLLSVVGRYWTVSVVLNSTGVQLEDDTRPFADYLTDDGGRTASDEGER